MSLKAEIITNNEEIERLNIVKNYDRLIKLVRKQIISDVKNKNFKPLEAMLKAIIYVDYRTTEFLIAFLQPKDRKEIQSKL